MDVGPTSIPALETADQAAQIPGELQLAQAGPLLLEMHRQQINHPATTHGCSLRTDRDVAVEKDRRVALEMAADQVSIEIHWQRSAPGGQRAVARP